MNGLDPTDSWLVAILVVGLIVGVVYQTVRAIDRTLERRHFRLRNQAHPAEWDR